MYDTKFYDTSRAGMVNSAAALVPDLMTTLGYPKTILDVGCGEGWWAAEFAKYDCDVTGMDGGWHGEHQLGDRFIPHDLMKPLPTGNYDVVLCLEVAEHLRGRRSRTFIAELCALADKFVVFSAAIPGQGGTGHINEQWPDYWARLFNENGFQVNSEYRFTIWDDDRIENWYRQNLLIAYPSETMSESPPLRVVHPVLYNARRS